MGWDAGGMEWEWEMEWKGAQEEEAKAACGPHCSVPTSAPPAGSGGDPTSLSQATRVILYPGPSVAFCFEGTEVCGLHPVCLPCLDQLSIPTRSLGAVILQRPMQRPKETAALVWGHT